MTPPPPPASSDNEEVGSTADEATSGSGGRQPGAGRSGVDLKVGGLAAGDVLSTGPDASLREAAEAMHERGVGSIVVLDEDEDLVGILTERDLLGCIARQVDLDATSVADEMTDEVVAAAPDWEVYEAAAEMTDQHIRHLVVVDAGEVVGVLSIRDVLLAGQRVELTDGRWAVLRDPLTLSIRERRRLQKYLLELEPGTVEDADVDRLVGLLVASWSFDLALPADEEALAELSDDDHELLRTAVFDELPALQRAVQPAPGWRHWRE